MAGLLELREEGDDVLELFGRQVLERGHRRRRIDERACDRLPWQTVPDLRQVRPGPGVAVVADLVAGETARLSPGRLPAFVFLQRLATGLDDALRGLEFDRRRRARVRALVGQERHRGDDGDA